MDDIIFRLVDLPLCVKGITMPNNDGTYNIYINARYPENIQRCALLHELKHIKNFDFDNFAEIDFIEKRAAGKI